MRIGLIAPPWTPIPPPAYGGIEMVVDRLANGFQAAGHEVLLFTTGDSACPVPRQSILPTAEGWRIGMAVPELIHVAAAYDAVGECDIVHDHTVIGPFYAERYPTLPVVTTMHGPLDGELRDIYTRLADRVPLIAISKAQCAPAPGLAVARIIHHGVDVDDFPVGGGQGGYFLFLGRMAPEKGANRAMEAANKAGAKLIMAAKVREPRELEYFEHCVQPYLNDNLVYVGEADNKQKLELLAGATALLFPIRWNEPFGMVMIEALACGTPVLAFPEGAAPEVIDDGRTGLLCDDVDAMSDAIVRVHTLDRAECRSAVQERFSTPRMVDQHVELFEQVIRTRRRR